MPKKLCELCHERPATVPDRERMGRPINRVCSICHGKRLAGDLRAIVYRDNWKGGDAFRESFTHSRPDTTR